MQILIRQMSRTTATTRQSPPHILFNLTMPIKFGMKTYKYT